MRILAQTSISPIITVYDTITANEPDSPAAKVMKKILAPVVQVQGDDGTVIYKTGEFYNPIGFYVLVGLTIFFIGSYLFKKKKKKRILSNPKFKKAKRRKSEVKIYDNVLEIKAQKGENSLWPKENFKHKFSKKHKAGVYGQKDGSLVIRGDVPFWKTFEY